MKIVLVLPDGVGIRNFLCTRFIDQLLADGEVVIWHGLADNLVALHRGRWGDRVRWERLPHYHEGVLERLVRPAKAQAQLHAFAQEDHYDCIRRTRLIARRRMSLQGTVVQGTADLLGRAFASVRGAARLDAWHFRRAAASPLLPVYVNFLQQEHPDVIFCAHQRAVTAVPCLIAARQLGIPSATFVYSWDNLPKGRMAVPADHYLLWSDLMRDEMRRYYPEKPEASLHVCGTPQFEHYFNTTLFEEREPFLRRLGLDPARKLVLFSGDDMATSPFDPCYLADLAAALRRLPETARPQICFRRCPADLSKRYQSVLEQYPEIVVSEPAWIDTGDGNWTQTVPTMDDVRLLCNLARHCNVVVNVGSTMAMDFAIFDNPTVFLAYDPPPALSTPFRIADIYGYPHYKRFDQLQPVHWAKSAATLGEIVMHALAHPQEKAEARRRWVEAQVCQPMDQASERLVAALRAIAGGKA